MAKPSYASPLPKPGYDARGINISNDTMSLIVQIHHHGGSAMLAATGKPH